MTRKAKLLGIFLVTVLAIAVLLIDCAQPSPTPSSSPKPSPAPTQSAADFYKNNTVTIVVGFSAGGGTDTAARLLTAFWTDVTGGSVRIKNQPGGDGILGANAAYDAKPDGLTLGVYTIGSMASGALFKDPAVKYEIGKFTYLGLFGQEAECFGISVKQPAKTMAELQQVKGLKFGSTGKKPEIGLAMVIRLFALQGAYIVPGFPSTPEAGLAAGKGEIDGTAASMSSIKAEVDKGFLKPMLTLDYKKSPWYPNQPTILELIKPTADDQKLLDIYMPLISGRLLFGPPGMPEDRVQYLREVLVKIIASNGLKQMAKAYWNTVQPAVPGAEVAATMAKLRTIPESEIAAFNKVVDSYIRR